MSVRKPCLLTSHELALHLGLSAQTVLRCYREGLLSGFQVPSKNRQPRHRFRLETALEFAEKHGLPTEGLWAEMAKRQGHVVGQSILFVTPSLHARLPGDLDVTVAGDLLHAGLILRARAFFAVVIDGAIGRDNVIRLAGWLVEHAPAMHAFLVLTDDGRSHDWSGYTFRAYWRQPLDGHVIAKAFQECLRLSGPDARPQQGQGKAKRRKG